MKYYEGDIIEVLNYGDNHTCNVPYRIGGRYTCTDDSYHNDTQVNIAVNNNYTAGSHILVNQITLYRRPIKNVFRSIFNV